MKELISSKTTQDKKERKSRESYSSMDFPPYSYRTPPFRKRARSIETSPAKFYDDSNSRRRRYEHYHLMGYLRKINPPTIDGKVK